MSDKARKIMIKVICLVLVFGIAGTSLLYLFSSLGWI